VTRKPGVPARAVANVDRPELAANIVTTTAASVQPGAKLHEKKTMGSTPPARPGAKAR